MSNRHRLYVRRAFRSAILFAAFFSGGARADDAAVVASVRKAVVFVTATKTELSGKTTTETGTGYIISAKGYALTANHLVHEPNTEVTVTLGSRFGTALPVQVLPNSYGNDASLLRLPATHAPYDSVTLGDPDLLRQADHLLSVGFPLTEDYTPTSGILGNTASLNGMWQIDMPLNYGNSGGPVLNARGEVVGIVKGGVYDAHDISYMLNNNLLSALYINAGIRWPPYVASNPVFPREIPKGTVVTASKGTVITASKGAVITVRKNCHEVIDAAFGFPPTYTKRMVCE